MVCAAAISNRLELKLTPMAPVPALFRVSGTHFIQLKTAIINPPLLRLSRRFLPVMGRQRAQTV